jgi:ATP-dependent DNA helicase DinG
MAKKPPIRVALDLETTGLHAEQDSILEVAAVKFQGASVLDTLETLVAPGRSIPYRVQRLTGITSQQLVGAPHFESIARSLALFVGDFPIVGHSIPFDVSFLRRRGLVRTNPLIDTFELATVLLPSLPSYNLGQVAEALGVTVASGRHRAMVDTILAMRVFLALHERLQAVDLSLLKDLASLDAPRTWPLLAFFRQELRDRQEQDGFQGLPLRGSLGDRFAAQLGMDPRVLSFAITRQENAENAARNENPSPTVEVQSAAPALNALEQMQTLVEVIPERAEQPAPKGYQTARTAVREALEQRTSLLMEVTVGGNDYTPALLPALEWLSESLLKAPVPLPVVPQTEVAAWKEDEPPRRLVIACSNAQGARRLVETVLPRLQASLKMNVPVAYLAEHGGYLCIHRWFGAALRRTSGELTAEQARGLAKLGLWAQQTLSGERSELTMLPQEITAWERISSGVERVPSALTPLAVPQAELPPPARLPGGQSVHEENEQSGSAYQRCIYRRKGYCFVSRAEERINAATIVVTTHAGLLDDLCLSPYYLPSRQGLLFRGQGQQGSIPGLPTERSPQASLLATINRRLILDADLLEEEIARWSNSELNQTHLIGLLNTIGMELPDSRYQGLLALAAPALRENGPGGLSATPTVAKSELDARMRVWFQALAHASMAVNNLFSCFSQLLEEFLLQGSSSSGSGRNKGGSSRGGRNTERTDQPLRLTGQTCNLGAWTNVERAWLQTEQRLQSVIDLVHEAERIILTTQRGHHRLDVGSGVDDSVATELAAIAQQLLKQRHLGQQALSLGESDMVYWLRVPPTSPFAQQPAPLPVPQPGFRAGNDAASGSSSDTTLPAPQAGLPLPVLYAQLVHSAAIVKRAINFTGSCTILAGASLSADNNFSFYRGRLGLENDAIPAFSVVTEHHEQTLLYLPNDVPEPNMPQYQRHLDDALIQLTSALDGQTVALFTSHAALRSSYAAIKPVLESRGILVLGQGIDGSPRQLWHIFSTQERVIVLGAGNFWDSIGEINNVPACLFITRLPMPVLNDPPVAARAEQYSDQLHQLTVPAASLRLRRALNRLAWSETKRNAVVLFDRRVISKEYGSTVLHTLPRCSQRQSAVSHMPEMILDWLTTTGAWE